MKNIELNKFTGTVIFKETVTAKQEYLGFAGQIIPHNRINFSPDPIEGDVFIGNSGYELVYTKEGFILRTDDKTDWLPEKARKEFYKKL